jgi:hypothetical protein
LPGWGIIYLNPTTLSSIPSRCDPGSCQLHPGYFAATAAPDISGGLAGVISVSAARISAPTMVYLIAVFGGALAVSPGAHREQARIGDAVSAVAVRRLRFLEPLAVGLSRPATRPA